MFHKNQSIRGFALLPLLNPDTLKEDLSSLFGLAQSGNLKVVIGGRYPLEGAALFCDVSRVEVSRDVGLAESGFRPTASLNLARNRHSSRVYGRNAYSINAPELPALAD